MMQEKLKTSPNNLFFLIARQFFAMLSVYYFNPKEHCYELRI